MLTEIALSLYNLYCEDLLENFILISKNSVV